MPQLTLKASDTEFIFQFDLPGCDNDYEYVRFLWKPTENKYIFKGERKRPSDLIEASSNAWYGSFHREGPLPTPLDISRKYTTSHEHGSLK